MEAVATGAIGDRLGAGPGCQPVVRGVKADDAVGGETEPAGEWHIGMALAAGLADVRGAYGRGLVGRRQDGVLAVAGGADRGGGHAFGDRFSVDAGVELLRDLGVAHAAEVGDALVKRGGSGRLGFMGAAVADGAVGSGRVALPDGLAVNAAGVLGSYLRVALGTSRLGNARGVRIGLVSFVAGAAAQIRVSGGGQLVTLVVARRAPAPGSLPAPGGNRSPKGEPQDREHDWGTHGCELNPS